MSLGLVLNHISASGNHTETIVSGSSTASRGALYVSGAAAFGIPASVGGEVSFTWPGTDTTFFVKGAVAGDASATSFGTLGNYDIGVFGGKLVISGALNVAGSIRGGLEAKKANGSAATPVSQQVAFWTSDLYLSGTNKLRWDDNDLVVGGNLQIQGSTTTLSSSNLTIQDSILGLGFSGSDTFNNVGQRSIIFGKGASAGVLLPGLAWDGTRAYTIGAPQLPSSGTINFGYKSAGVSSGDIPIPGYNSGEQYNNPALIQSVYGAGAHAAKLVFPAVVNSAVAYPGLSGSYFQKDDLGYIDALHTDKLMDGNSFSFWGHSSDIAFGARHLPSGYTSYNKWTFSPTGFGGSSSIFGQDDQSVVLYGGNSGSKIHLSGANGHVAVKASDIRPSYDGEVDLGAAGTGWSAAYLESGAVLGFDVDNGSVGVSVTHSSGQLAVNGDLTRKAALGEVGTLNYFDSMSGDGQTAFLTQPQTLTQASTSIAFDLGFSATDVSQMAVGNVIAIEESGTHYYFVITTQPSTSDTSLSVTALGTGSSFGAQTYSAGTFSVGVDDYYAPMYATSYTAATEWRIGEDSKAWRVLYADDVDLNGNQTTGSFILDADRDSAIGSSGDDVIDWFVGNISTSKFFMNADGLYPKADNSYDLGKAAKRYRNIYTGDVNLQNDRGDWTLIEENDFISFRNNMTGRRFRMVMEDITGMGNYGPGNDGEM